MTNFNFCGVIFTTILLSICNQAFQVKHQRKRIFMELNNQPATLLPIDNSNIWRIRRKIVRACLTNEAKERLKTEEYGQESDEKKRDKRAKITLAISAFFVTVGAAVFRLGGRAAFVQLLGLDFLANEDLKGQLDTFVDSFTALGEWRYAAILGCWILAKLFCVDFATLVLALSSGVLFGGILQGGAVSVTCSTIASLIPFLLSRYTLRERAQIEIQKRPSWRAVERACSRDGLKTVFVLRLSPLLPIPIGAYNYLYGATSVSVSNFALGLSAGSLKPYLLDSYLGVYGKGIIDSGGDGQSDLLLGAVLFVLVLVGTFSTQLAESTYEEIQRESEVAMASLAANDTGGTDGLRLPVGVQQVLDDLKEAAQRVNTVILDEWIALQTEVRTAGLAEAVDAAVNWDGIVVHPALQSPYPGPLRVVEDWETRPLSGSARALTEYGYESLVFGWCLLSACGRAIALGNTPVATVGNGYSKHNSNSSLVVGDVTLTISSRPNEHKR